MDTGGEAYLEYGMVLETVDRFNHESNCICLYLYYDITFNDIMTVMIIMKGRGGKEHLWSTCDS